MRVHVSRIGVASVVVDQECRYAPTEVRAAVAVAAEDTRYPIAVPSGGNCAIDIDPVAILIGPVGGIDDLEAVPASNAPLKRLDKPCVVIAPVPRRLVDVCDVRPADQREVH